MMQLAPDIPGQPHRWANEIKAWADGKLVQWRYHFAEVPEGLQPIPDNPWRDACYPSRGIPNWYAEYIEFRIAPEGLQNCTPEQRKLLNEDGVWVHSDSPATKFEPPVINIDWGDKG